MKDWILRLIGKNKASEINASQAKEKSKRIELMLFESNFKEAIKTIKATIDNGYNYSLIPVYNCTDSQILALEKKLVDLGYRIEYKSFDKKERYIMKVYWD